MINLIERSAVASLPATLPRSRAFGFVLVRCRDGQPAYYRDNDGEWQCYLDETQAEYPKLYRRAAALVDAMERESRHATDGETVGIGLWRHDEFVRGEGRMPGPVEKYLKMERQLPGCASGRSR